jgi:hypothetical protein
MNIENDFLTDFDLFGKTPELYYNGKSKKSSTVGIVLTIIYIILYIAFLIYKLVRMFKRIDMTFYDSYTFKGLPSIKLTNNEFYGGFGMGGRIDEQMYYLTVNYVRQAKVNGVWVEEENRELETEICRFEMFGPDYQEIFADQPLKNYYCIKDVKDLVLEGYSNLERYSYFNVKFYPCIGVTKDGIPCYDYNTKKLFFTQNVIELKLQDNDLNPEDYKMPVARRQVDMNSPVFKDIFQLIYSYIQIVNIETDEDITGLNFFTDTIRKEQYTRYDESFIITSPLFFGDILNTGGPIADVTLQLAAKVLTEKRQYTQLIDVLGDVGGLMEILYSLFSVISSMVTEILYDRSLVNNLFSFDLKKKYVVFNKARNRGLQTNANNTLKDIRRIDSVNLQEKYKELKDNKDIVIFSKENSGDQTIEAKTNIPSSKKKVIKVIKKRKTQKNSTAKTLFQLKEQNTQEQNVPNNENKLSVDENKNIISVNNIPNEPIITVNDANISEKEDLRNVYINNWLICCFWFTNKKKNLNRVLFEEGSKIITERLDINNMFNHLFIAEIVQKKIGVEARGINMSENCISNLPI